ncbi:hypothetical protein BGX27_002560 [Mortierella sp. AM989]|nr:hypothetical protein BGX27_002560 [Mortierella sp. AM989]
MDFFASAYINESSNPPMNTPHSMQERAGQGYGRETNAHLRRASLGLESDITSSNSHRSQFSYGQVHHKNYDSNDINSPSDKDTNKKESDGSYFSLSVSPTSSPSTTSPTSAPSFQRRTSVSNPCLLHHTNTGDGGAVRSPTMPRSYSFNLKQQEKAPHEKPIPEGREPGL